MESRRKKQGDAIDLVLSSSNGRAAPFDTTDCAFCGTELEGGEAAVRRFGKPFCSEAHGEAFASEVRVARAEATAGPPAGDPGEEGQTPERGGGQWSLGRLLKLGACCGLPILALVFLAGGGGALLGAGAAVLPVLALLACPLGMFFMMRGMRQNGSGGAPRGPDESSGRRPRGEP